MHGNSLLFLFRQPLLITHLSCCLFYYLSLLFVFFFKFSPFSLPVRTWDWITSLIFRINETLITNPYGSLFYEALHIASSLTHFSFPPLSFSLIVRFPFSPSLLHLFTKGPQVPRVR